MALSFCATRVQVECQRGFAALRELVRAGFDKLSQRPLAGFDKLSQRPLAGFDKLSQRPLAGFDKLSRRPLAERVEANGRDGKIPKKRSTVTLPLQHPHGFLLRLT